MSCDLFCLIEAAFISPPSGERQGDEDESVYVHGNIMEVARKEVGERFCRAPHAAEFQTVDQELERGVVVGARRTRI